MKNILNFIKIKWNKVPLLRKAWLIGTIVFLLVVRIPCEELGCIVFIIPIFGTFVVTSLLIIFDYLKTFNKILLKIPKYVRWIILALPLTLVAKAWPYIFIFFWLCSQGECLFNNLFQKIFF